MKNQMDLGRLLRTAGKARSQQLSLFALLSLGMIESLTNGMVIAAEAVRVFFHADNCLFIRKELRDRTTDEIMSRGVQLTDLFDILATEEARRQFQRELASMRFLCLKLLEKK